MDDIHRRVLTRNRPYLIKEVMLEPLWPHVLAREIFTDEMVEHIQATGAKPSQMQRLLSDLCRRGPNAYNEFIECLVDTEQQHIVDKLNSSEQSLRGREPKFSTPPVMSSTTIGYDLGHSSSSSTIGHSCAPTRQVHRETSNGHHSAPSHAAAANHSLLRFSAAPSSANQVNEPVNPPTKPVDRRMSYERSSSVSTTAPLSDVVSLDQHTTGSSKTITLMDTTTSTTSSNNSISYTKAPLSFALSSHTDNHDNEVTPNRHVGGNSNADRVRRNLTSLLRSPVTQTDNGNGISLSSHSAGVQSTDHPQAVDVNPYPQVLGIPETSGRLKFSVQGSHGRINADWDSMYKMNSDPRGYCIIINNRHFTGHLKERLGTDVDRDNLYMLYSQLGYQICIQEDLTGMEMLLTLRDFAQLAHHKAVDSCVVILLTHGLEGQIYGSDAKLINLSEVFNFFDGNVCPGLQGKPKFFLVQACRGEKFDAGFDMPDNGQTDTAGPASQAIIDIQQQGINDINSLSRKLPSGSDFLIAYATVPGFVSWRNSEQGSWFIQALCEVFAKHCHHEDAVNMLVQVNNRVASIYESATKHKQMPSPVVLLRKKLFFFPLVSV